MKINIKDKISGYLKDNREEKEFRERLFALDTTPKKVMEDYHTLKIIKNVGTTFTPICAGVSLVNFALGDIYNSALFALATVYAGLAARMSSNSINLAENKLIANNLSTFIQKRDQIFMDPLEGKTPSVEETDPKKDTFEKLMFGDDFKFN